MALGASRGHVLALVFRQAVWPLGLGIAAGVAMSIVATRVLATQLFGVSAYDPVTFVAVVYGVGRGGARRQPDSRHTGLVGRSDAGAAHELSQPKGAFRPSLDPLLHALSAMRLSTAPARSDRVARFAALARTLR